MVNRGECEGGKSATAVGVKSAVGGWELFGWKVESGLCSEAISENRVKCKAQKKIYYISIYMYTYINLQSLRPAILSI